MTESKSFNIVFAPKNTQNGHLQDKNVHIAAFSFKIPISLCLATTRTRVAANALKVDSGHVIWNPSIIFKANQ